MRQLLLGSTACMIALVASGTVVAQTTASARAPQVEEVTITAQKRKETLSRVAVTADVVNASQLQQLNVTDITDLNKVVPAVSLNASTNGRTPYAMRGVSTTANESNVGLESGVGIEVDGVPVPSDSHAAQQVQDIETVEVLEGPQATLGGRAAAAGLINFVTRAPKNVFSGQVNGEFTTDGEERGDIFVTGPLAPSLNFSVSGYGNHTPYPIHNLYYGNNTYQNALGLRAKLQYKPDALLSATLTAHYQHSNSNGSNFVYTYISPGETLFGNPASVVGVTPSYKNLDVDTIVPDQGSHITDHDISLNASYVLGNVTLGSITAFQRESETDKQDIFIDDVDWTSGSIFTANGNDTFTQTLAVKQVSQEFKLSTSQDVPTDFVGGLFFSDLSVDSFTDRDAPIGAASATRFVPIYPPQYVLDAKPNTATYDIYGRLTHRFGSNLAITAGLRFNDDNLKATVHQIAAQGYPSNVTGSSSTNQGALVGDLTAKYNFTSSDMAYATYAHGYAPAAYNTATDLTGNFILSPIKRMDINHFEIGTKGRYLDGALQLNADVFYTIYDNYQVQTYESGTGQASPPLVLTNAPQAQTHGVEASGTWRPSVETTLGFNAAYIDATFTNYKDATCWFSSGAAYLAGTNCYLKPGTTSTLLTDVSGKPLPNSPNFKFVLNGEQRFPLDGLGYDLVAGAVYSWRSRDQMSPDQNPYTVQKAFGLLNLNLRLQSQNGKYSFTAFANNVMGQVYYTDVEDFWTAPWAAFSSTALHNTTVVSQPARDAKRYEGIRFTAKF